MKLYISAIRNICLYKTLHIYTYMYTYKIIYYEHKIQFLLLCNIKVT